MLVKLDLRDVQQKFELSIKQLESLSVHIVKACTQEVFRNWTALAKTNLHKGRNEYIKGLLQVDVGRFQGSVVLVGVFNNMIEKGASAFDMKIGFEKSTKAIRTAKGWYLTIPFRHATPGAIGENEAFSTVMPKAVHQAMRQQAPGKPLRQVPAPFDERFIRGAFSDVNSKQSFGDYQHKASLYEGLTRYEKIASNNKPQNQYRTFRRVSNNSDPASWIHKGLAAKNFARRAVIQTPFPAIVDEAASIYLSTVLR